MANASSPWPHGQHPTGQIMSNAGNYIIHETETDYILADGTRESKLKPRPLVTRARGTPEIVKQNLSLLLSDEWSLALSAESTGGRGAHALAVNAHVEPVLGKILAFRNEIVEQVSQICFHVYSPLNEDTDFIDRIIFEDKWSLQISEAGKTNVVAAVYDVNRIKAARRS